MATLARTRPRRRRRDHPPARVTLLRGMLVFLIAGLLGLQLLRLYNGVPTTDYKEVYVSAPLVGNLLSHDAVRVAGKRVGQVLKIDVGSDGQPRVKLQLNPGTKLPADTQVRLRANGLLGARYVELVPGKSTEMLADHAVIRGDERSYTYGLPEAIDVFDSATRKGAQETIGGLGAGMLGNGAGLNNLLKIARARTPQFEEIMRGILARKGSAERLLPATDAAFVNFERNTRYIEPWTRALGDALVPFIAEREATRSTLQQAPPALASMNSGLGRGVKLLTALRHLSTAAADTLPPMPRGVRALSTLLETGRIEATRLDGFIGQARAGLNAPYDLLPHTPPVRPRVAEVLKNIRPLLQELSDHSCDFRNGAATLRSMTGFEQAGTSQLGPLMAFRLQAVVPGADGIGLGGAGTLMKRAGYPADCTYDSKPYPQFTGTGTRRGNR